MEEMFDLVNKMSPYLLLGFFLAGLMHVFIPNTLYSKYLAGRNFRSVILSALFGIPLPLCSCGVIPTAMSLRKEGASKGATVSFLIATPQTGVDSIIATYSLLGLPFAIIRPIVALCTSIFGGNLVNIFDDTAEGVPTATAQKKETEVKQKSFVQKVIEALKYAYIDMMQDIGKWLVIGLVVAGLITVFVPNSFFALFAGNTFLSMLFVLCLAIPMYLCATGSIPIAVALMLKGLTPGAALVMLMAGPACNVASILVINKVLGKKTMVLYLISIISGAVLFGTGIDYLLPREWFTPTFVETAMDCCEKSTDWFKVGCTILLALMLLNALTLRLRHKHQGCSCGCGCGCHEEEESHCHCHDDDDDCCNRECHCHEEEGKAEEVAIPFHIYNVKGMNCNHCRTSVENAIAALENVDEVHVYLETNTAEVKGTATKEEIRGAVESIGFELA